MNKVYVVSGYSTADHHEQHRLAI